jgi:hypothetical protein
MGWKDTLQFTNAMPFFDDTIESKSDGVDADLQQAQNLQQLAFRWKGTICRADGILGSYENDENFQLERYHTWTTWVDLVTQTMEQMSIRSSAQDEYHSTKHTAGQFWTIGRPRNHYFNTCATVRIT